jgi:hypothetical protein
MWISRLRQEPRAADWGDARAARLAGRLAAFASVTGAAQNIVVDKAHPVAAGVPQGVPAADAVTEVWFADQDALGRFVAAEEEGSVLFSDPLLETLGAYAVEELTIL